MPRKKVNYLPDSASVKVVVYTTDPPYGKGRPGYVSEKQPITGDLEFIDDLWLAMARDRKEWERLLPSFKSRTRKMLGTHQAVALLGTVEE